MIRRISFTLGMPNRGSWNGKWSGEDRMYVVVRKFSGKKGSELADKLLASPYYYYGWSDGWVASVTLKEVDGKESAKLKRKSNGFCGYEWMIDSICQHGCIKTND